MPSTKPKRVRKVLREINYDSDASMGSDSDMSVAPVKGRNSIEKAALSKKFQKKGMLEHILLRADVYIGSPNKTEEKVWVYNSKKKAMDFKSISYSPGLYKIFDEILVNAADNKQRDASMRSIKVTIDKESGEISVQNDGKGIPVEMHQEHKMYIPELIFGHLLTGENFEDSKERIVGGKNGYGAKLTNIFSKWFQVETVDSKSGLKYVQKWTENMTKKEKPKITKCASKAKDYTKITFRPDFKRFQSDELEDDTYDLFCKRVYDIAGITHLSLKVHLNGEKLAIDRFEKYVDMYIKSINGADKKKKSDDEDSDAESEEPSFVKIYEKINPFWEVCVTQSPGSYGQLSFVNSICTYKGGKHVDYVTDLMVKNLAAKLNTDKEMKKANITNSAIKNNLFVFVNCLVVNPTFNSQSKEYLATTASKFGDKKNLPVLSSRTINALNKSEILDRIKASVSAQNLKKINRKTKGKRSGPLIIDKLEDAKNAGTKKWRDCTILLTEGDSAKTTAISGLSVIGRDNYGVFPLKGKLLNVRDATTSQITKNKEIENICKIVGLAVGDKVDPEIFKKTGKKNGLRYGHIMIMTDQDHDGSHIKGLLFNFIHNYWPELLKEVPNFIQVFITPIIKCFPKNEKKETLSFYTMPEYEQWCEENRENLSKYIIKYYKGLGTSSKKEAKEYFKDLKKHKIQMKWDAEANVSGKALELAFSKKKAAQRKEWLTDYNKEFGAGDSAGGFVDFSKKKMTYSTFVNKELVHFSLADNIRSIPSAVDGMKPSQRKVLYGCIKKFLSRTDYSKQTQKVATLSGYISGATSYHHGEMSLQGTIVSMAQDFVGSNNINFLTPSGQFGSRLAGGKDASQARYISSGVTRLLSKVFRREDEGILNFLQEEGKTIEPEYYLPILPTVLINGAQGIGTGWSTDIAMHNPKDLVKWLKRRMDSDSGKSVGPIVPLHPWYRAFKGTVYKVKQDKYKSRGVFTLEEDDYTDEYKLLISELPVNKWTNDYKKFISELLEKEIGSETPRILSISNDSSDDHVDFTISISKPFYNVLLKDEALLIKTFALERSVSGTSNMVLFDYKHRIRRYENQHEILEEFFRFRKKKYIARKEHLISVMEANKKKLSNEQRFVNDVATGAISITRRKKEDLEKELEEKGFDKWGVVKAKKSEEEEEDEEEEEEQKSFAYLLKISILNLTMEKVKKLKEKYDVLCEKLEAYRKRDIFDIWREELDEFLEVYDNYLVETSCENIHQETVVPAIFKHKADAIGRLSLMSTGSISALSKKMDNICEVTPKLSKVKAVVSSAHIEKKARIDKKAKIINLDDTESDISMLSDSENDSVVKSVQKPKKKVVSKAKKVIATKRTIPKTKAKKSEVSMFSSDEGSESDASIKPVKKTTTKPKRTLKKPKTVSKVVPKAKKVLKKKAPEPIVLSDSDPEISSDEDSDEEVKPKVMKKKTVSKVISSDEESESEVKTKVERKKSISSDLSDFTADDMSEVETVVASPKPKREVRGKRKAAAIVVSDESDATEEESIFSEAEDSESEFSESD